MKINYGMKAKYQYKATSTSAKQPPKIKFERTYDVGDYVYISLAQYSITKFIKCTITKVSEDRDGQSMWIEDMQGVRMRIYAIDEHDLTNHIPIKKLTNIYNELKFL